MDTTHIVLSPEHMRVEFLFCGMPNLTCYNTERNDNLSYSDFLEVLARLAFRLYNPDRITRSIDVSIARLLYYHSLVSIVQYNIGWVHSTD